MASSKPPTKPPGGKPFLGDDDLLSELDAWDATFDALHGTDESGGGGGGGGLGGSRALAEDDGLGGLGPLPGRPASEIADPTALLEVDANDPRGLDRLASEFDVIDDEPPSGGEFPPMTLDGALEDPTVDRPASEAHHAVARPGLVSPAPPEDDRLPSVTGVEMQQIDDAFETDFSDLAVSGRRARQTLPPSGDEDDDDMPSIRIQRGSAPSFGPTDDPIVTQPGRPISRLGGGVPRPPSEDDVYTSASRPNPLAKRPSSYDDDDRVAPPPPPSAPSAPEPRRGPAIVRRTIAQPVAQPISRDDSQVTPPHGHDVSLFERTRIADASELEEHASASARSSTAVPVIEDAYDDIEIGDSPRAGAGAPAAPAAIAPVASAPIAAPDAGAGRRTAHVLRRTATPTRPQPSSARSQSPTAPPETGAAAAELSQRPTPPPDAEDDFSDVAAAVGADGDIEDAAGLDRMQSASAHIELSVDDDEPAPPPAPLAQELALAPADEDEFGADETHAIDEPAPDVATMLDSPTVLVPTLTPAARAPGTLPRPSVSPGARASQPELYPSRVKTPTSVPPLGRLAATLPSLAPAPPAPPPTRQARASAPPPVAPPAEPPAAAPGEHEDEPALDLDAIGRAWPEQVSPLPTAVLDEACAGALLVYEREIASLDDGAASAALRIEAGRLCERLADLERARTHYDAALLADPRATAALRGLRRIARAAGDLVEATSLLDSEIAVAGGLERRPLGHYRIDLLMASGEQDLARVAVGELLDTAPSDVRALLAHLELAFLDGRADEFGSGLEQLAQAVTDPELRSAAQAARGALAAHHSDNAAAMAWFSAAAEADPGALAARLGAVRYAAAQADGDAVARALVDLARQVESTDPITAAAATVRAQQWAGGEIAAAAAAISTAAAPADPLVARLGAESASPLAADDPAAAAAAFSHWAAAAGSPAERAHAAARAAELDPARGAELWAQALALDPDDDYAAAQLRTAHVAREATDASIEVDIAITADLERDRARLRAAFGLMAAGRLDEAIDLLARGRAARPGALAIAEALAEALAATGDWTSRARLFAELAAEPGEQLDREVAQLRSAVAWEEAVGAATAEPPPDGVEVDVPAVITAALDAWERVLEHGAQAPTAHAATIILASRLGDRDALAEALTRAQAAERSPWAAASLALRRARLYNDDPQLVEAILRDLHPPDDPRRTLGLVMTAARMSDTGAAAAALEERSRLLDEATASTEIAALRLRAAQLALDAGDAPRATQLLGRVEQALPTLGVVPDLLAAARRRAGDRPSPQTHGQAERGAQPGASAADAFVRVVRDADLAAAQGDAPAALALYQRALELRPGDPLATVPLIRTATLLREPAPVTTLALAQLQAAEDTGDGPAKAAAYELLSHIDAELRNDPDSARIALESASRSDPSRIDLLHRLERERATDDDVPELIRLRRAALDALPPELIGDRAALLLDLAGLAARDNRIEAEVAELYRAALVLDPAARLALLHLESIVRRGGFSEELARLEEQIAAFFEGDPKAQAAFYTRAGETLAELGQIDAAVQRFGRAEAALPGHVPALEGWRQAALKGQLWLDVAEAATRQAAGAEDLRQRAALHHLAGVALMDKALDGDRARAALHKALEADRGHRDAFLRLRILLEEDANHDELAILLGHRLEVETDDDARVELHRALAELHRNFLSDRDTAKVHYRAILTQDPNDLRSHAAIADIAWEQGNWQEAADALVARARLEREPDVLKTLCFRLGLIYADRLVDPPMALKAFQRALSYEPDDENTLVRLADLAAQTGEYKLALGACERLVKNEADPDRRVAHLHRVARIFQTGFGDAKRAERALNLALDAAPTNDEALQQLVQFYRDARDLTSARVHLNRVAGSMRAKVQQAPLEGVPYRVIARAMAARAATGFAGSQPIARAAAQLAELLGAADEPERKLLAEPATPDLTLLGKPDADEVLFPRGVQVELRQIFQLLGDRIAKHVGVDLRPYGATRGDRLRAKDNPVAAVAQSIATGLGFGEIDVYVSSRQPWVMVAEPTSPVSLIIGSSIAAEGGDAIRFAAGSALKLAQAHLAIPARLPADDLGVLVVALMRLFQPEFPMLAVDPDGVAAQLQKLRRLIPTSLLNELRPFALAIDSQRFGHRELARDLKVAGLRAGLVSAGSLLVGLRILAGQAQAELPAFLTDPVAQGLISFALGEDHAAVAR